MRRRPGDIPLRVTILSATVSLSTVRPGRLPSVQLEQVVVAAVALADEHGLDGVTFRALARELGVSPMAVHRTTGGIDRLRHAVVSRTVSEAVRDIDWPADWQGVVALFAHELRALLLRHPVVLEAHRQGPLDAPGSAEVVEAVLGALHGAGLEERLALEAYAAVHDYVTGHVAMQLGRGNRVELPSTASPRQQRHRRLLEQPDYDKRFAVGVDLLLRGVQSLLPATKRRSRTS